MQWWNFLVGVAVVEAAAIEKRQNAQLQTGLGLVQSLAAAQRKKPLEPTSVTKLQSTFPQATRQRVTWGPFNLQPANVKALTSFLSTT